ncbi:signal peptidase I [Luteithermobacter gelatinilyticus]|uniref:signal peptidase I n=1 Tax=Luteithermobacter gelatinilyticus TaxID=2582913 RepID=UPI00110737D1|nr:signal peptidase I [Luteithermobacter gelatinilyticus]|tara:strand:- start:1703 stop:2527 length:825 start_codon:yes stop_codon:yes gene_type:complete
MSNNIKDQVNASPETKDQAKGQAKDQAKDQESWLDFAKTIFYAILIAVFFRSFVYQPFTIPSESMLKNLMIGDYLLVSKFSYGFSRHSLPFSLPLFSGRIFESPVERGDVAVFRLPRDPGTYYIKRIVGLPGDRIQMKKGVLYINGEAVRRERLEDYVRINEHGRRESFEQYRETLPNGKSYIVLDKGYSPFNHADDTQVFRVPEGHYFAMGDNRDNSRDSRLPKDVGVGYVPYENIIGRAEWITLSFDNKARLWEFWKWFPEERRERFFTTIH